jgi:PEP-CTERM motif
MKKSRLFAGRLGFRAAAACLVAGIAGSAGAAQLWYDGIATPPYVADTSNATPLNGQSGGTGTFFTGAWSHQSGNDHHVAATSLPNYNNAFDTIPGTMPLNPSVGGSIVGTDTPGGCCDTARDARLFSSPWDGFTNPDGTFYMSFFANFGKGPTMHHRVMEMWDGDHTNDGNRNLQLGYSEFTGVGSGASPNTQMGISVHDSNDSTNHNADLAGGPTFGADGRTHLIVLRFDLSNSANDRIRAYLDPIGTLEPGSAAADISVGEFLADRMGAITDFTFGDTKKASAMDEIRVGTTFADVANLQPAPEPASLVLMGLGAIGFGVMARRRHG